METKTYYKFILDTYSNKLTYSIELYTDKNIKVPGLKSEEEIIFDKVISTISDGFTGLSFLNLKDNDLSKAKKMFKDFFEEKIKEQKEKIDNIFKILE